MDFDLVVLAGGRASRMGGVDKVSVPLNGLSSLDRLLSATPRASRIVVVGPQRRTMRQVSWCREDPPGGGPLAAVAAALPLTSARVVLIAAGDMPRLGEVMGELVAALRTQPQADVAAVRDLAQVLQPLAAAYRRDALVEQLEHIGDPDGRPARLLLEGVSVIPFDGGSAAVDCDTWADIYRVTEELGRA